MGITMTPMLTPFRRPSGILNFYVVPDPVSMGENTMLIKKCSLLSLIFFIFLSPAIGSAYYFETTIGNGGWESSPGPISNGASLAFSHGWWHYEDGWRESEMPPNHFEDEFLLSVKSDRGSNGNIDLNIETQLTYNLTLTASNATGDFSFPIFYRITLYDVSNSDQTTLKDSFNFISTFPGTASYDRSQSQQVQIELNRLYVADFSADAIPAGPFNTHITSPTNSGLYPDAYMMFSGGPTVKVELSLPSEPVPEPSSIVLYAIGAIVIGRHIRRKQIKKIL